MKSLCFAFYLILQCIFGKGEGAQWCYAVEECSGCIGPRDWQTLDGSKCGGPAQSPINVVTGNLKYNSQLKPFTFVGYDKAYNYTMTNNGHSAFIDLSRTSMSIKDGGLSGTYNIVQLHFHWGSEMSEGSEHSINGERFPMELHIVHNSSGGHLAVLGFFYEENTSNNTKYDGIINGLNMITSKGSIANVTNLRLVDLIPESRELELYYRYNGSLTTPNCDEIVTWTLFPNTIKLSKGQLEAFYKNLNFTVNDKMEENFRPVQKLNGRIVQTSDAISVLSQTVTLIIPVLLSLLFFTS
ncbi:carbonic anhydrase 4-like [Pelobates fuscus]|uniref:carbonic anhydrase 4-like n=1 Tax=Pelobates fuscus TaxID=191477 RepID=UPI002FE47139